jgi:pimeloyl-ACP methyl ester carboxylesterase
VAISVAVRYAAQHRDQVRGLVLIDGTYPIAMFDKAGKQRVRAQFRRLGWIMRILAAPGRSARMYADETADVVIEMHAINGELGPDMAALDCPTAYIVGTLSRSRARRSTSHALNTRCSWECPARAPLVSAGVSSRDLSDQRLRRAPRLRRSGWPGGHPPRRGLNEGISCVPRDLNS